MENDDDIRALAQAGRLIEASRLYRERHRVSFSEADAAVRAMEKSAAGPPLITSYSPLVTPAPLGSSATGPSGPPPAAAAVRSYEPAPVPEPPVPAAAMAGQPEYLPELLALLEAKQKLPAIKLLRERTGLGLKEAKEMVDALALGQHVHLPPSRAAAEPEGGAAAAGGQAAQENLLAEIDALLRTGNKFHAINLLREKTGIGLAEAAQWVEERTNYLGAGAGAGPKPKSGCFIATAAYGTPLAPEVAVLRRFRDRILRRVPLGPRFICWYYRTSPPLAEGLAVSRPGRAVVRVILRPLIAFCRLCLRNQ